MVESRQALKYMLKLSMISKSGQFGFVYLCVGGKHGHIQGSLFVLAWTDNAV